MILAIENQEIMDIYKIWSARALKNCLNGLATEERYSQQLQDCLDRIIEEIAVISEERTRMNPV